MEIKKDPRHYYLKGLLRQCYESPFNNDYNENVQTVTKKYRRPGQDNYEVAIMTKNQVFETAIDYIAELEAEVETLQYIARIIAMAKEN